MLLQLTEKIPPTTSWKSRTISATTPHPPNLVGCKQFAFAIRAKLGFTPQMDVGPYANAGNYALHEGMKGCVLQSGSFNVNTGVKQGCGLAPALFSIFLAAFISLAAVEQAKGVGIIYRTDGELAVQHAPP